MTTLRPQSEPVSAKFVAVLLVARRRLAHVTVLHERRAILIARSHVSPIPDLGLFDELADIGEPFNLPPSGPHGGEVGPRVMFRLLRDQAGAYARKQ